LAFGNLAFSKKQKITVRRAPSDSDSQAPLESWHEEALKAMWTSPQAVKAHYGNASICANNRVVFNIGGNKYRLVVEMQYRAYSRSHAPAWERIRTLNNG